MRFYIIISIEQKKNYNALCNHNDIFQVVIYYKGGIYRMKPKDE